MYAIVHREPPTCRRRLEMGWKYDGTVGGGMSLEPILSDLVS